MESQSQTSPRISGELLSDAKGVGQSAVNRLHSEVDNRKGGAASQVVAISSAVERAAESLDGDAPTWLKPALEKGATQIRAFAETLEQKDSRQLANDVSDFARSSPGTFLAVCAAAGFAAARVFKSGSSENDPATMGTAENQDQRKNEFSSDLSGVNHSAVALQGEYT